MSDIRLVNVVPIVNGWNDAAKKNLEEAKTLMASGNHLDCSIVFFGGELDDNDPCNMCDAVGYRMVEIMEQKLARWKYRLMKKEDVDVPEE